MDAFNAVVDMFTLDTNVIIYFAAGDPEISNFLAEHRSQVFYVPSIVVAEFLSYPLMTSAAAERLHDFIRQTILINLDYTVAVAAAKIRRTHRLPLADAVIAASAITTNSSLVTRNVHDFQKVKGLTIVSP
mgnify:CR=1 FL=1